MDNREQNYEIARKFMVNNITEPITNDLILAIHAKVLPSNQILEFAREGAAQIENPKIKEIRYIGAHRAKYSMARLLEKHLSWYASSENNLQPIEIAARFHWGFVKIHPFDDGNGRTARILTYHILLNRGYTDEQCKLLERFFVKDRDTLYIESLNDSMSYNGFNNVSKAWLTYMHDLNLQIIALSN